jgi:gamma-glutamyltranspeptidase
MKRKVKMAVQAPSFRPAVIGTHYGVATGHYLATAAAMRILDGGGNAVDAGVCAVMQHPQTGLRHAGADPRREGYAAAW